MAYKSLAKLFYADASDARFERNELLAKERLEAESTFRTGIASEVGEFFLAVPRELSVLNEQLLMGERRVSAGLGRLSPTARRQLIYGLIIDEVVSTNKIEGIHSTRRQIGELLDSLGGTGDDGLATRRFRELAKLYLDLSGGDLVAPTTPQDIRSTYDQVMCGEDLGGNAPDGALFRRGGVEVIGAGGKVLHRGVEPESAIFESLEKMIALTQSPEIPKTYSALMAHYLFEHIHPFYDGNGRTGRYLLALNLSESLSLLTVLSLSSGIAAERSAYYKLFQETEKPLNHAELTMFVMGMLELTLEAQGALVQGLHEKDEGLLAAEERLAALVLSCGLGEKEADVLCLLVQHELYGAFPEASLAEVAQHLGLKTQMSRKYVGRLEEQGLVWAVNRKPLRFALTDDGRLALGL